MKILWVGDSPNVETGFSRCTRAACYELIAEGHQVAIIGINEPGDTPTDDTEWVPKPTPPFPIYRPANAYDGGRDGFGVTRLPRLMHRMKPDLVVLLNDPWNVPPYMRGIKQYANVLQGVEGSQAKPAKEQARDILNIPVIAWLAVDARNQKGADLEGLDRVAVWTEFAKHELRVGGYLGPCDVVPLGVDSKRFHPLPTYDDHLKARVNLTNRPIPEDAFLVGAFGRNQPRKRLDLTLSYFADWVHAYDIDDAYLYIHTAPTGERGCDIRALAKFHGLEGRLILSETEPGQGLPDADMARSYQALDVYLSTTQGEGWGLPALEAMACGVPCVLPDWSAFGDWARGTALLVPCSGTALTAPINGNPYTVGGVADRLKTMDALQKLYAPTMRRRMYEKYGTRGRKLAETLTWERTARGVVTWAERAYDVANAPKLSHAKGAPTGG